MTVRYPMLAMLMLAAPPALADDAKYQYGDVEKHTVDAKKPTVWHANMSAGLVWVGGNAESIGVSGTALVSVKHWHNELTLSGGGAYVYSGFSKFGTGVPVTEKTTSARNGLIKLRYTVFASFQSSGDQFAGYWYRLEPQVGYARVFFKSPHQAFRGEIGCDYTVSFL